MTRPRLSGLINGTTSVFLFLFVTMLEQKNIEILKPMLASVIVQLNKKNIMVLKDIL